MQNSDVGGMNGMTRVQIAYRGFAQLAAWLMTLMVWLGPPAYVANSFRVLPWEFDHAVYVGIGSFVVLRYFRDWAQSEADGRN